ncbi:hypothetical protein FPRO05_08479 [Fusarium proliferatum]|uniref:Enolase C-terminal domain-containing protein n=1 Tax=Gibberella intermedia TaxID=948311 RepID=A0A365NK86_GIBIN|nr:hypothetical protein FPRO05_08479 [Fusarium proliferatum]
MPVCELLGGRTDVGLPIISSIYMDNPENMRKRVAKHRARGYMGHSVKIGGEPGEDARRITASLADMQPGEFFLVDANGGMTVENAPRMLRLLPPGLDFVLEAPLCHMARNRLPSSKKQRTYSLRRARYHRRIDNPDDSR